MEFPRLVIVTSVTMMTSVFNDMSPCSVVHIYRYLERICCFHIYGRFYHTTTSSNSIIQQSSVFMYLFVLVYCLFNDTVQRQVVGLLANSEFETTWK